MGWGWGRIIGGYFNILLLENYFCIYYLKCVIFRAHVPYFLKIISGLGSGDWMLGGVVRSRIVLGLRAPEQCSAAGVSQSQPRAQSPEFLSNLLNC